MSILGAGSPLNKFELIDIELSRNSKTVYVDLTGNDLTGDGSLTKPFKTIERALQEATGVIAMLDISLADGEHTMSFLTFTGVDFSFTGTGSINFIAGGTYNFIVERARVEFNVPVTDTASTNDYPIAFAVTENGVLVFRNDVDLTRCTGSLLFSGHGQNAYYASHAGVTSVNAISKVAATTNSEPVSIQDVVSTYTNIT
jgi:hypothetical protein